MMRPECPKCGSHSFMQIDESPLGECLTCGESYFLGLPYIDIDALIKTSEDPR
jgi:predicted  nucleic acid-binding Zn-ribbon protein